MDTMFWVTRNDCFVKLYKFHRTAIVRTADEGALETILGHMVCFP